MRSRVAAVAAIAGAVLFVPTLGAADDAPAVAESPERLVETERLMATLEALPRNRAGLGGEAGRAGLRETEAWLAERLEALGHGVERHAFAWAPMGRLRDEYRHDDADAPPLWHNLIVDLPGEGSPEEVVLLGAHFDAVPGSPGADDNGTGVAALLEAARVLRGRPTERTIRLVFFNLEEAGLIGSRAYVEDVVVPRRESGEERVVGMVSLEMLGYYSDEPGSQSSPFPAIPGVFEPPGRGDFLAITTVAAHRGFSRAWAEAMKASEPGLPVFVVDFFPVAPPDLLRSDHAPFLVENIPALMATDTANFRNPHYHRATDTPETIDRERFTKAARALIGAAYRVAGPVKDASDD